MSAPGSLGKRADFNLERFAFPPAVLRKISSRITNEVAGVNRVTYDISSKPPGVSPFYSFLNYALLTLSIDNRVAVNDRSFVVLWNRC